MTVVCRYIYLGVILRCWSSQQKQLGVLQYQCDQAKEEQKQLLLLKEKLNMMAGSATVCVF